MSEILQTGRLSPGKTTIAAEFSAGVVVTWVKDITGRYLPTVIREVARRVMVEVVELSPVDTGLFVSSWEVSAGAPIVRGRTGGVGRFTLAKQVYQDSRGRMRSFDRVRTMSGAHYVKIARLRSAMVHGADSKGDFGGRSAQRQKIAEINSFFGSRMGNKVENYYLTNSLPYARKLEDGSSNQAPHGMVKITMAKIPAIIADVMAQRK